ncbi:hypothetical protein C2845_PM18G04160 [Panicum miliaceum]|uniref:Uncharacterized protein n=1 Tax=Panicum miliaceum TaxID=4540 RepID=A0A3L6PIN3_PANMI|nr:hypothetical protein C2845_PM18G04160 [Panicum miliaceum]
MSSAAPTPSANNNSHALKRNSGDIGWDYGVLVDPNNLNVIKCIFCPMIMKARIYRLKCYIAGIRGDVKPYPSAPDEDRAKCKKAIDDSKKAKRARIQEKEEVRDAVDIEGAPDNEDTTIVVPDDNGLDDVGESSTRKVGPMDKYTLPMDPSSLANTKVVRQQKVTEAIMKDRMQKFKRYIAKWVYVHGNELVPCIHA